MSRRRFLMVGITLAAGDLVDGCARVAVGRLRRLLGDDLVGAWLIGSGALGGAVAESSDLDLVAVCAHAPSVDLIQQVVGGLTEEAMTWPVRGLEFVLYPRAAVASASRSPQFALNLNVGPRMPLHLSRNAAAEPTHWFVIDLAILREHGLAIHGPPPMSWWRRSLDAGCWTRSGMGWPGTPPTNRRCTRVC